MVLYITAVKPKNVHKGNEAIFYIRDSEKKKSIVVEEKVDHLFVTYELKPEKAFSLEDKLLKQFPKEKIKLKEYGVNKYVIHFYGNVEDKNKLPSEFIRNVDKKFSPHSCYFSHEEVRKKLDEIRDDKNKKDKKFEKIKNLEFEIIDRKEHSYLTVSCDKRDLRNLPDYFKKFEVKTKYGFKTKEQAETVKEQIKKRINDNLGRITFLKPYKYKDKWYFKAIANKEGIDLLSDDLFDKSEKIYSFISKGNRTDPLGLNSFQRMLNWRFPVFSIVELKNGHIDFSKYKEFVQERVPLEEVLNDTKCAMDIETSRDGEIYMVIINDGLKKILYTTLDLGVDEYSGAKIINKISEREIVKIVGDFQRNSDYLFFIGHNIQEFDLKNMKRYGRLKGNERYRPGANLDEPRIKSSKIGKVDTLSRFIIDTIYLRKTINYLENCKLATYLQRYGFDFEKERTYDELEELYQKAKKGDKEAAKNLADYTIKDGDVSLQLGKVCLENILLKSYLFNCSPTDVCKTSDKHLFSNLRAKQYFLNLNTFRDRRQYGKSFEKEIFELDELKFEFLNLNEVKTGKFENAFMVYYSPFVEIFENIINKNPDAKIIMEKIKNISNPDLKVDLLRTLNSFLAEPVTDFINYLKKFGYKFGKERIDPHKFYNSNNIKEEKAKSLGDYILRKAYSLDDLELCKYKGISVINENNRFFDRILEINKILKESKFINGKKMLFFEKPVENAVNFGGGLLISIEKEKYIGNFNGSLIKEGINLMKRGIEKELRKNQAEFVKDLIKDLMENKKDNLESKLKSEFANELHPDLKKVLRSMMSLPKYKIKGEQLCFPNM